MNLNVDEAYTLFNFVLLRQFSPFRDQKREERAKSGMKMLRIYSATPQGVAVSFFLLFFLAKTQAKREDMPPEADVLDCVHRKIVSKHLSFYFHFFIFSILSFNNNIIDSALNFHFVHFCTTPCFYFYNAEKN